MKAPNLSTIYAKRTTKFGGENKAKAAILEDILDNQTIFRVFFDGEQVGWTADYKLALESARELMQTTNNINQNR